MFKKVPITLISGYLGSGKTTLLNNILANDKGYKIAVIVNDIGEVNIDAELISKGGMVSSQDDSLVPLQNGCICCTLNEDLIKQICELIGKGKFDHIVIEASGICEPQPIVQSIVAIGDMCEENGVPRICDLDAVVTVVDAVRLVSEFSCGDDISKDSEDSIENLICQQIEFCDVIVLNKSSDVSKSDLERVKVILRTLQPRAKIIETDYSKVDLDEVLDTKLFDFDKTLGSSTWIQELEKDHEDIRADREHHDEHHHECHKDHKDDEEHECHCHHGDGEECHCHEEGHECHHHDHEEGHCHCGHHHEHGHDHVEEYNISTFVYYRRKPMDRKKWFDFTSEKWGRNIIRSKGLVYFSDAMDDSYLFEQAGVQKSIKDNGMWYASLPKESIDQMLAEIPEMKKDWDEEYGDRMVKLVFIGQDMDKEALTKRLDEI